MGKVVNEYYADFCNGEYALLVRFLEGGWRCGYIGVRADHPLHGVNMDDYPGNYTPHGGITFSGYINNNHVINIGNLPKIDVDRWYFGFDCAHCGDANDIFSRKMYFPESVLNGLPYHYHDDETVWTKEMVRHELVEWLIDIVKWVENVLEWSDKEDEEEPKSIIKDAWLIESRSTVQKTECACSRCGFNIVKYGVVYNLPDTCPECGAKMHGERWMERDKEEGNR